MIHPFSIDIRTGVDDVDGRYVYYGWQGTYKADTIEEIVVLIKHDLRVHRIDNESEYPNRERIGKI